MAIGEITLAKSEPVSWRRYYELTKPKVVMLILFTALVGMLLAWCIRGSVLAAMPWSWITNPLTTVPLWYGCYRLGAALFPGHHTVTWDGLRVIVDQLQAMSLLDGLVHGVEILGGVFLPLLLGTLIVGLLTALPTWWLVRRAAVAVQTRRAARCAHWKTRLAPKAPDDKS